MSFAARLGALLALLLSFTVVNPSRVQAATINTVRITSQSTVTAVYGTGPDVQVNDTVTFEILVYGSPTPVASPDDSAFAWCGRGVSCTVQSWTLTDATWSATYRRGQDIIHVESGELANISGAHSPRTVNDPPRAEVQLTNHDGDLVLSQNAAGGALTDTSGDFAQFAAQLHQSTQFDTTFFLVHHPTWFTYQYDYTRPQNHAIITVDTFQSGDVSYDMNGASGSLDRQRGAVNSVVSIAPNAPTRDGHTFSGWNTARDGTGVGYQPGDPLTIPGSGATTLYAQWTPVNQPVVAVAAVTSPSSARYITGNKRVTVRWSAVDGATSYAVTTTAGTTKCTTGETSCRISGLRNGKMYTYHVRSVNAAGVTSADSRSVRVIPGFKLRTTTHKVRKSPKLTSIVTTASKGTKSWSVRSGSCRISNGRLIMPSKKGTCRLRLSVAKRGSYPAMSTTVRITATR